MLLGYADIKEPLAVILAEFLKPRAQSHCGGYQANAPVFSRHFAHQLAELAAEGHARRFRLACVDIKV